MILGSKGPRTPDPPPHFHSAVTSRRASSRGENLARPTPVPAYQQVGRANWLRSPQGLRPGAAPGSYTPCRHGSPPHVGESDDLALTPYPKDVRRLMLCAFSGPDTPV